MGLPAAGILALVFLLHLFGLGLWRPYAPLMTVFCLCFLAWAFWRGRPLPGQAAAGWAYAAAGAAAILLYTYYRAGGVMERLPLVLVFVPALLDLFLFRVLRWSAAWPRRVKALLGVLMIAAVGWTGWLFIPFFRLRVAMMLGLPAAQSFVTLLYASGVAELRGLDLLSLLDPLRSYGFSLLLVPVITLNLIRRRRTPSRESPAGALGIAAVVMVVLSWMFLRAAPLLIFICFTLGAGFLAPLISGTEGDAPAAGSSPDSDNETDFSDVSQSRSPADAAPDRPGARFRNRVQGWFSMRGLAIAVLLVGIGLLPLFVWQARLRIAEAARIKEEPLFAWLRTNTPPGAVIAAHWDMGYEIQTYGQRAVLMDGFFENPLALRRIELFYRALFSSDERELWAQLNQWQATDLLLDQRMFIPMARFLGYDWQTLIVPGPASPGGWEPSKAGRQLNYLRCLFHPEECRWLRLAGRSGPYAILRPVAPER